MKPAQARLLIAACAIITLSVRFQAQGNPYDKIEIRTERVTSSLHIIESAAPYWYIRSLYEAYIAQGV